jgi:hypothetical protein
MWKSSEKEPVVKTLPQKSIEQEEQSDGTVCLRSVPAGFVTLVLVRVRSPVQCGLGTFISDLKSTASQIVVAADLEEVDFTGCGPRSIRVVYRHHEYG